MLRRRCLGNVNRPWPRMHGPGDRGRQRAEGVCSCVPHVRLRSRRLNRWPPGSRWTGLLPSARWLAAPMGSDARVSSDASAAAYAQPDEQHDDGSDDGSDDAGGLEEAVLFENGSTASGLLTLPEAAWELSLGIYCAWKGFRREAGSPVQKWQRLSRASRPRPFPCAPPLLPRSSIDRLAVSSKGRAAGPVLG